MPARTFGIPTDGPWIEILLDRWSEQGPRPPEDQPRALIGVPALIDTGATITAIPEGTARALGLPDLGPKTVDGFGGTSVTGRLHPVRIEFGAGLVQEVTAVEIPLLSECLIGWDILALAQTHIDGPACELTLTLP